MKIIPASIQSIPFIANRLIQEYQKLNQEIGVDFYKTDYEFFTKILETRLNDQSSEFKYFVLIDDNNESLWFISLLQKTRGEILLISLINEDKEHVKQLLEFGIQYLRQQGSEYLIFEASPFEQDYQDLLLTLGAKHISSKFVL